MKRRNMSIKASDSSRKIKCEPTMISRPNVKMESGETSSGIRQKSRNIRAKKSKVSAESETFKTPESMIIEDNERIDESKYNFELLDDPLDENDPYAALFSGRRSISLKNAPNPLLTPQSRHIPCTPREYFLGLTKNSPYREKKHSSQEAVFPVKPLQSKTPMTDYAKQHSLYLASIQGRKDLEELRASVCQKKLFTSDNEEPLKGIIFNKLCYNVSL